MTTKREDLSKQQREFVKSSRFDVILLARSWSQVYNHRNVKRKPAPMKVRDKNELKAELQGIQIALDELEVKYQQGLLDIGRYLQLKADFEARKANLQELASLSRAHPPAEHAQSGAVKESLQRAALALDWRWVAAAGTALVALVVIVFLLSQLGGNGKEPVAPTATKTVVVATPKPTDTATPEPSARPKSTHAATPLEPSSILKPTNTAIPQPSATPPPTDTTPPEPSPTPPPTDTAPPEPTATPTLGIGSTTREADGMTMVYVPGGAFLMGSEDGDDDERPMHRVTLGSFWIDRTEVSNAQYALCVASGECRASSYADNDDYNGGEYPVVGVSWQDAADYCAWAGARLPTEAEWEYAARRSQVNVYTWGNDEADCDKANYGGCVGATSAVGSYPAGVSWCGALDMAGNVWEWMDDWYNGYPNTSHQSDAFGTQYKVLRGGSWLDNPLIIRSAYRYYFTPDYCVNFVGLRCVREPGG
jgi:formylglycine-generating enzyme required for sulfatase activity